MLEHVLGLLLGLWEGQGAHGADRPQKGLVPRDPPPVARWSGAVGPGSAWGPGLCLLWEAQGAVPALHTQLTLF